MADSLEDELLELITKRIAGHERSQQTEIGPSGLGTPCNRKLGFRLAQIPPLPGGEPPWRPTVGTAVHTWLDSMLTSQRVNRWLTEISVPVGTINGRTINGTLDVYDTITKTIVDWKIPGPKAIKDHRTFINKTGHVVEEYRKQLHIYGRGMVHAGYPVQTVAIMFLPMNGELSEALYWSEPYDPAIGTEAFHRARAIDEVGHEVGWDVLLPKLTTVNDHCGHCPWFAPGSTDPLECRGDASLWATLTPPSVEDLLQ